MEKENNNNKKIVGFLDFGIWGGMLGQQFPKGKKKKRKEKKNEYEIVE